MDYQKQSADIANKMQQTAGKLLARVLNRKRARKLAIGFAKKAAMGCFKAIAALIKFCISIISAFVGTLGSMATFVLPLVAIIAVCTFFIFFFNDDEKVSNNPDGILLDRAMETIDKKKSEQVPWRVPGVLLGSATYTIFDSSKENGTDEGEEDEEEKDLSNQDIILLNRLMKLFSEDIKPIITYEDYQLEVQSYTVETYYDTGISYESSISTSTKVVNAIASVDTWRGIYKRDVGKSKKFTQWKVVETKKITQKNEDGEIVEIGIRETYKREEILDDVFFQPNGDDFTRLINNFEKFGAGPFEIRLMEMMYNAKVPNDVEITATPIDLSQYIDYGVTTGYAMIDGEDVPEELLTNDYFWPVPCITRVSSAFGKRVHPITGEVSNHLGMDISDGNAGGTPIYAIADGEVLFAGPINNTYGQLIIIDHGDGLFSRYAHLQWDKYGVAAGDTVKKGQYIGQIGHGKVGRSTGPHLHLEIQISAEYKGSGRSNGSFVNPALFVKKPSDEVRKKLCGNGKN